MRVVLADDTMLLREGVALLLGEAGFDVVGQAGDRRGARRAASASTRPTSRSSTCGCRPRTPTRACRPRSTIRAQHPGTSACSCSPSTPTSASR